MARDQIQAKTKRFTGEIPRAEQVSEKDLKDPTSLGYALIVAATHRGVALLREHRNHPGVVLTPDQQKKKDMALALVENVPDLVIQRALDSVHKHHRPEDAKMIAGYRSLPASTPLQGADPPQ